jgi:hypothetical protein
MLTFISNFAHYKEVLSRVLHLKESLWIGTADIKDLWRKTNLIGFFQFLFRCALKWHTLPVSLWR